MLPPVFAEDRVLIPRQRACPRAPDDEPRPDHDHWPQFRHSGSGMRSGARLAPRTWTHRRRELHPAPRRTDTGSRHAANATEPGARQQGGRASDRLLAGRPMPAGRQHYRLVARTHGLIQLSRAHPVSQLRGVRVPRSSARSNPPAPARLAPSSLEEISHRGSRAGTVWIGGSEREHVTDVDRGGSQARRKPHRRGAFRPWARLVSNQRPLACEASALPLSYAPEAGRV
jgi:hypothetical protein